MLRDCSFGSFSEKHFTFGNTYPNLTPFKKWCAELEEFYCSNSLFFRLYYYLTPIGSQFSRYVIAASNCTLQHCYVCPLTLVANHVLNFYVYINHTYRHVLFTKSPSSAFASSLLLFIYIDTFTATLFSVLEYSLFQWLCRGSAKAWIKGF